MKIVTELYDYFKSKRYIDEKMIISLLMIKRFRDTVLNSELNIDMFATKNEENKSSVLRTFCNFFPKDINEFLDMQHHLQEFDDSDIKIIFEIFEKYNIGIKEYNHSFFCDARMLLLSNYQDKGAGVGAYYTPADLADLIANLAMSDIENNEIIEPFNIYDMCSGAGELLFATKEKLEEKTGAKAEIYGQDLDPIAVAMLRFEICLQELTVKIENTAKLYKSVFGKEFTKVDEKMHFHEVYFKTKTILSFKNW